MNPSKTEKWVKHACFRIEFRLAFFLLLTPYVFLLVPYARIEKLIRKIMGKKPRIIWGSTPILNIRHGSKAARMMGYKSDTVVYTRSVLDSDDDFDYTIRDLLGRWIDTEKAASRVVLGLIMPYFAFYWATFNYDIFHMYFDGGILWPYLRTHIEIPLLHLAGKKVIVVPYGCEARIQSEALKRKAGFCQHCPPDFKVCDEAATRKRVNYFCKHGDIVMECSETVGYFPRSDGVWLYPIDNDEWQPVQADNGDLIKIVHATNHRVLKGSDLLFRAIDELKAEGFNIKLVMVEKTANREAKKIYETADIIADQFLAGWYAMFAIEGMALGKPVICYISDEFTSYHPEWDDCPIINTPPDKIKDKLIMLIENKLLRVDLGKKGVKYVEKYHSLRATGARLDKMYRRLW